MSRLFSSFLSKKARKHTDVCQVFISIADTSAHLVIGPAKKAGPIEDVLGDSGAIAEPDRSHSGGAKRPLRPTAPRAALSPLATKWMCEFILIFEYKTIEDKRREEMVL